MCKCNDGSNGKHCSLFQSVEMAPPIETPTKVSSYQHSPNPRLNERILSSISRKHVAAHPWHDLEIGKQYHCKIVTS